jgi:hypothetical protein
VTLSLGTHKFCHGLSHLGRVVDDLDTVGLETSDLGLGVSLTSRDDGSSMTHSSSWWGSLPSDEADDRQISVIML